jgi:hypothetical protein
MNSNLQVSSNLMLEDPEHQPHYKWMPGDYVATIYKEFLNPEYIHQCLTPRQQREHLQYLSCILCGRACAGTCGSERANSVRKRR